MLRQSMTISILLTLTASAFAGGNIVITTPGTITDDIDGNVVVLNGAVVTIQDATINGNLTIDEGSSVALSGATINGNVKVSGDSAFATTTSGSGSEINGNVIANNTVSLALFDDLGGTLITGNLNVKRSGPDLLVGFASVRGNVNLKKNETFGATFFLTQIDGNLICKGNSEVPALIDVTVEGNTICD